MTYGSESAASVLPTTPQRLTMLDATKVFDRVEYCRLIRLLSIKSVPAVTIRFLLNLYL